MICSTLYVYIIIIIYVYLAAMVTVSKSILARVQIHIVVRYLLWWQQQSTRFCSRFQHFLFCFGSFNTTFIHTFYFSFQLSFMLLFFSSFVDISNFNGKILLFQTKKRQNKISSNCGKYLRRNGNMSAYVYYEWEWECVCATT